MPKKFHLADKMKWLELYEGGKTELWIARNHARCDPRTVRRGLEEAQRKQDVKLARIELVKDALRKHQDSLLAELDEMLQSLIMPEVDFAVLSWGRTNNSDFTEEATAEKGVRKDNNSKAREGSKAKAVTVHDLLREHLKNDRVWKALAQRERNHITNMATKAAFQRKIIKLLREKTGYKMVDKNDDSPPFLYLHDTCDLLYSTIVNNAFESRKTVNLENDIFTDSTNGLVRTNRVILAEAPSEEESCKKNILEALKSLQESSELRRVIDTHHQLVDSTLNARQIIEQIKLLGIIPGRCQVCRRLGI
jgi:hypothetical protein